MSAVDKVSLFARVSQVMERVEYKQANAAELRESVFRLRYNAYLREGAIFPNARGTLEDDFDGSENARLFAILLDGTLAASIRIHVLSDRSQSGPARQAFPEVIEPLLERGEIVLDPNRFVIDHDASRRAPELAYAVLRIPMMAASYYRANTSTATVRREHQSFCSRVLRYQTVSPPRPYPTLIKPLGLMTVNCARETEAVLARYPFLAAQHGEAEKILGAGHELHGLEAQRNS